MLSKIVKPGDRLELTRVAAAAISSENNSKNEKIPTYFSKIYDIIGEDKLKIAMPMEGTRVVITNLNARFDICMFTDGGLYRCKGIVVERYKEDNLYVMVIEIYTTIQKYQRRQHYRFPCNFPLKYQLLTKEEEEALLEGLTPELEKTVLAEKEYIEGIALDISGGGIHFVSKYQAEEDSPIMCYFSVMIQGQEKSYSILSRMLQTKELFNKRNTYEHRIQFEKITDQEREELIRFIFEEERRHRKVKKG